MRQRIRLGGTQRSLLNEQPLKLSFAFSNHFQQYSGRPRVRGRIPQTTTHFQSLACLRDEVFTLHLACLPLDRCLSIPHIGDVRIGQIRFSQINAGHQQEMVDVEDVREDPRMSFR